jgi:hypothetical protein
MSNPFTFEAESFELPTAGEAGAYPEQESWETGSPFAYEAEGPAAPPAVLNPTDLARAVEANRSLARRLGWGCVKQGRIQSITDEHNRIRELLHLPENASEEDIAKAVAEFQADFSRSKLRQRADGQLGQATWNALVRLGAIPQARYKPESWTVSAGGRILGVIEKSRAYTTQQSGGGSGVTIEFGFRVTDMEAVRRAGFVDDKGEPAFRWIQIVELRTIFGDADPTHFGFPADTEQKIQRLRRAGHGFIIDPSKPMIALDTAPYYWDEGAENDRNKNRRGENGICYTTRFADAPTIPDVAARPGLRAYFNFETALVGVVPKNRNVILNTVRWGFDIIRVGSGVKMGVNPLHAGPTGGSPAMRKVLSNEVAAGSFTDNHCFVGGGFSRGATCGPATPPAQPEISDELRGFPDFRYESEFEDAPAPQPMVRHVDCQKLDRKLPIFKAIGTTDPVMVIEAACQRAVAMLDNVIRDMGRIRDRVAAGDAPAQALIGADLMWSLQTRMLMKVTQRGAWTGSGPRTAEQIIRWLSNIRKTLAEGNLRYICLNDTVCNRFGPETWAVSQPGREFLILCRRFWHPKTNDAATHLEFQAQTLIHEVSHIYYDTTDSGRGPGHAECISQFVTDANGGPIDPDFANFCGGLRPARP